MKTRIYLNAAVASPLSRQTIKKVVYTAHHYEKKITGIIEVYFIGERRMRTLNRIHRGIDKATDVLSFSWPDDGIRPGKFLGQIFLAPQYIKQQARRFKVKYREELIRMLIHGLLHCVGYDHATKKQAEIMFSLQEKISKNLS